VAPDKFATRQAVNQGNAPLTNNAKQDNCASHQSAVYSNANKIQTARPPTNASAALALGVPSTKIAQMTNNAYLVYASIPPPSPSAKMTAIAEADKDAAKGFAQVCVSANPIQIATQAIYATAARVLGAILTAIAKVDTGASTTNAPSNLHQPLLVEATPIAKVEPPAKMEIVYPVHRHV
jgi:hypothetical protein